MTYFLLAPLHLLFLLPILPLFHSWLGCVPEDGGRLGGKREMSSVNLIISGVVLHWRLGRPRRLLQGSADWSSIIIIYIQKKEGS